MELFQQWFCNFDNLFDMFVFGTLHKRQLAIPRWMRVCRNVKINPTFSTQGKWTLIFQATAKLQNLLPIWSFFADSSPDNCQRRICTNQIESSGSRFAPWWKKNDRKEIFLSKSQAHKLLIWSNLSHRVYLYLADKTTRYRFYNVNHRIAGQSKFMRRNKREQNETYDLFDELKVGFPFHHCLPNGPHVFI